MRDINNETIVVRKNIQIHVGKTYINQQGEQRITSSARSFTLAGDNKSNAGRDAFVGEISNRIKAGENAGKGIK